MRTTAILNLKGGVGKTTTVIHMANILHRDYGARVLVVDCDHQHNLTQFFDADPKKGSTTKVLTMDWHDGISTGLICQKILCFRSNNGIVCSHSFFYIIKCKYVLFGRT